MQYCTELVGPKRELQSVNRPLHSFKPYISPHEGQWTIVTIVQTPPTCLASQKVYEAPRSHAHKIVSSHFRATPRPSRLAECDPGPCAQHASHMYLYTFRLFRRGFFFLPCHFSHFEEGRMESSGDGWHKQPTQGCCNDLPWPATWDRRHQQHATNACKSSQCCQHSKRTPRPLSVQVCANGLIVDACQDDAETNEESSGKVQRSYVKQVKTIKA